MLRTYSIGTLALSLVACACAGNDTADGHTEYGAVAQAACATENNTSPASASSHTYTVRTRRDAVVTFAQAPGATNHCTGTLITSNLVLTAAHCMHGSNDPEYFQWATFFYDPDETPPNLDHWYRVVDEVEDAGIAPVSRDYVIFELEGNPAADLGVSPTPVRAFAPSRHDSMGAILIHHPRQYDPFDGTKIVSYGRITRTRDLENGDYQLRSTTATAGSSSGAGLLDYYNGYLFGVHNGPGACNEGQVATSLVDIAHVSPIIRSLTRPVSLKATGDQGGRATLRASCGSSIGQHCDFEVGSDDTWADMRRGCNIGCEPGTLADLRCTVEPSSHSSRKLTTLTVQRTRVDEAAKSYEVYNTSAYTCSSYSCSKTVRVNAPILATCRYNETGD